MRHLRRWWKLRCLVASCSRPFPGTKISTRMAMWWTLPSGTIIYLPSRPNTYFMPSRTVVIRADASSEIGIGHVMRCLALGQAWQSRGGRVVFALASGAHQVQDHIRSHSAEMFTIEGVPGSMREAALTLELSEKCNASWLVVDGYHFSANYLSTLRSSRARLLVVIDDGRIP